MKSLFVLFASFAIAISSFAQGGHPDKLFGDNGVVFGKLRSAEAVNVLSDDKFLVAGLDKSSDYAVEKYLSNGQSDLSFGNSGIASVIIPPPAGHNPLGSVNCMAVQPDGKILLAGESNRRFALVRFTTDGKLDHTLNGTGIVTFSPNGSQGGVTTVKVQTDGKILLSGNAADDFCLVRLNSDGSFDQSFNGTGVAITDIEQYGGNPEALVLQPNGKIIQCGRISLGLIGGHQFRLVSFKVDGAIDSSFGNNGIVTDGFIDFHESIRSAALLPDGSFYLSGLISTENDGDIMIVKYKSDGSRDGSFGVNGYSYVDLEHGSHEYISDMVVQNDGKLLLTGQFVYKGASGKVNMFVARFNSDGKLDNSFGSNGKYVQNSILDYEYFSDNARGIALQSNGKIIVVGSTVQREPTYASLSVVLRYHSDQTAEVPLLYNKYDLTLYPNPASNHISVSAVENLHDTRLSIINAGGQTVIESVMRGKEKLVDISTLPKGTYFVHLVNEDRSLQSTRKFVKQ